MAEWIKYENCNECKNEILEAAKKGFVIIEHKDGTESRLTGDITDPVWFEDIRYYLICEPHPHCELIVEWARTGKPVYFKGNWDKRWSLVSEPSWNPECRYALLNPYRELVKFRSYLVMGEEGVTVKCAIERTTESTNIEELEASEFFIKWIDKDWREVYL